MKYPFEISPGTVTDETVYSSPGVWSDSNNGRYRYGKPEPIGGWEAYHGTLLTGVCRTTRAWVDNLGQQNIAFGTHSALMVVKNGELYDITPSGLTTGEIDSQTYESGYGGGYYGMGGYGVGESERPARTWSLDNWGENLVAVPADGAPYIWANNPASDATVISQAPQNCRRMIVTPERQMLVFGCVDTNGVYNPMCIRGCDLEDYTSWTPTSSNNAFEHILEGGGVIIDARMFGSLLLVWTDTGLWVGQFIGEADQTYRFDKVGNGCGLLAPQSAIVYNQSAYWWTPDLQFYVYQYGGVPTPVPCPIRREFSQNLDATQTAKIVMATVGLYQEIWTFYPDSRDGDENSRFVAVCLNDNTWFKGAIARTSYIDSGPLAYPLGVDYAGQTYWHEKGNDANGSALSWYFESSPQYVAEGERRILLRGVWPDFEAQQGEVLLTFKVYDYPQSTPKTKGPYALPAGKEKKDFMVEGRLISVKISGSDAPSFARLGKPVFDGVPTGAR